MPGKDEAHEHGDERDELLADDRVLVLHRDVVEVLEDVAEVALDEPAVEEHGNKHHHCAVDRVR
jgi:hypothetical protein